jgi:hypothetical protein
MSTYVVNDAADQRRNLGCKRALTHLALPCDFLRIISLFVPLAFHINVFKRKRASTPLAVPLRPTPANTIIFQHLSLSLSPFVPLPFHHCVFRRKRARTPPAMPFHPTLTMSVLFSISLCSPSVSRLCVQAQKGPDASGSATPPNATSDAEKGIERIMVPRKKTAKVCVGC